MKQANIKNASGKITGQVTFESNKIIIDNIGKPILELYGTIVEEIYKKNRNNDILLTLYNEYYLSIGEIAALYDVCYSNINKQLKTIPNWKSDHKGRRNRAYGKPVSKTQSEKMSRALKGRAPTYYERTDEIKQKISNSLKAYYKEHPQNPEPHKQNWKNGVYDNVDFKKGIGGYFTSIKNNKTFKFRSLLELYYMIILEENNSIKTYDYEPFHIPMDNGSSYIPDFLVDDKIIELKAKKYVERVEGVKDKVLYKQQQAQQYCAQHNLQYQIIYDEDIDFDSKKMKRFIINHPDKVKKYNIKFLDEKRMVTK